MGVLKILGKCFSVMYSVIFTFILLVFVVALFITSMISTDFIVETFKSVDLSTFKVSDIDLPSEYQTKYGNNATLEDVVVGEMVASGLEEDTARDFINDDNVREFIGEKAREMLDAEITDRDISKVSEEDVAKALENINVTDENIEAITDFFNEFIDEYNKGGMN